MALPAKPAARRRILAAMLVASCFIAPQLANAAGAPGVETPFQDDGSFPTADQVGGDVFPAGIQPGTPFPTDVALFDSDNREMTLGDVLDGKRTLLTFFITAAPASVAELKKIEKFADGKDIQIVFANSDVVGNALFGGKETAVSDTVRTVAIIKDEQGLGTPIYVAPNNVFDPGGLSNRLGFRGLPTSYLIAADGTLERVFVGGRDWSDADLAAAQPSAADTNATNDAQVTAGGN